MAKRKSESRGLLGRWTDAVLVVANVAAALALLAVSVSPMVHPSRLPWVVSAGLTFPIFLALNAGFIVLWILRRPRWAAVSVTTGLLCLPAIRTYIPLNFHTTPERGALKVMSYNVKGFAASEAEKNSHFRDMLDYIGHSEADILCLQEALRPEGSRYNSSIDSTLRRWTYQDSLMLGNGNCLLLCSNYPILYRRLVKSPSEAYGCAIYKVKIGRDTVAVINSHFVSNAMSTTDKRRFKDIIEEPADHSTKSHIHSLTRKIDKAGVKRAKQEQALEMALKELGDMPVIMCGDFNDSPLSYVHFRITRRLNDAYTRTGNGVGISFHESGMYFRLDNILASHHWKPYGARVDSNIKASDHYPIYAWLKLQRH